MKDLIAIVIIGIAIFAAYGTGLLWYHRTDLLEMHLTNKRHKRYQQELKNAHIRRVPANVLGTQIRKPDDYSHMFGRW